MITHHQLARLLLLGLLAMLTVLPVRAQGHIVESAYYEDRSGRLTIDHVLDRPFTPFEGMYSDGYRQSVTWIRLTVMPVGQPLLLIVKQLFLDELTLFAPTDQPGQWRVTEGGERVRLIGQPQVRESHIFEINPIEPTIYYLMVRTSSANMVEVQALTSAQWYSLNLRELGYQVLFIGLMLAILLWASSDFVVRREPLVGWFVIAQFMQVVFSLTLMGYLAPLFPADYDIDQLTLVVIPATVAVNMLFHRILIGPFQPSLWALRMLDLLLASTVLEIMLILLGYPRQGMQLGGVNLLLFIPTLLWLAYSTRVDALPGRLALRIAYNALAVALALTFMPLLGWADSVDFYLTALTMQGLAGAVIIGIFLYKRSSAIQSHAMESKIKLERIEQGLRDHQTKLDEQRQFMDMLSHELKTPISVIQLTLDALTLPDKKRSRLERALKTMSDVIDRCRFSMQIDEQKLTVVKEVFDYRDLVEDVVDASLAPARVDWHVEPIFVNTDYQLLSVVLHNLIDNALKYSPENSTVRVDLDAEKDRFVRGLVLTVSNTYQGTIAPDSKTIFDKYVRGPTSTGLSGSGLGLHLCRCLSEMLGGSLSSQVLGTRIEFTLWLPDDESERRKTSDVLSVMNLYQT